MQFSQDSAVLVLVVSVCTDGRGSDGSALHFCSERRKTVMRCCCDGNLNPRAL